MTKVVKTKQPRPGKGGKPTPPRETPTSGHPKMEIVAQGMDPFVVPYAPRETTTDGFAPGFATAERGGRRPLVIQSSLGNPTMTFDLIVAYPDPNRSCEHILKSLQALAESGARMTVKLDKTSARFRWRLTTYSQQVIDRQHGSNNATRAICSFTFTAASDPVVAVGPLTGGKSGKGGKGKRPKSYVVKKGDTLQKIADRFYDDPKKWRAIADRNKIRDPKKLKVGTKLELP